MKEYIFSKRLMGTEIDISIITNNKILAEKKSEKIFQEIEKYENIFSRFKESSELSILNREKNKKVSKIFFEVFLEAKRLFEISGEKFNPLVQIKRFGYNNSFEQLDKNIKLDNSKVNLNFNEIEFNEKNREITLKKNQELDFGGFLKGYLAEKLTKKFLSEEEIFGSIINFGGDIFTQGLDENGKEFIFSIYNPIAKKDILEIPLKNQALATSGIYKRNWIIADKTFFHILNEQNKVINGGIISASLIHQDTSMTDALATAVIAMKISEAEVFLESKKIKYILLTKNNRIIKN